MEDEIMFKRLLIFLSAFFLITVFVSCVRMDKSSVSQEDLEKQIVDLKTQLEQERKEASKREMDEQQDAENVKKASDQLAESLKEEIAKNQITINRYRDALIINIIEEIFFDSGKADIKKKGFKVLDRIGNIIKNLHNKMIKIEGHTDNVPIAEGYKDTFPNNWSLGAARAISVAEYFENNLNIDPKRLEVISFSKYRPVVPNTSAKNRARNRRIEIVLVNDSPYHR
jgi:chemotaxis protein MotB